MPWSSYKPARERVGKMRGDSALFGACLLRQYLQYFSVAHPYPLLLTILHALNRLKNSWKSLSPQCVKNQPHSSFFISIHHSVFSSVYYFLKFSGVPEQAFTIYGLIWLYFMAHKKTDIKSMERTVDDRSWISYSKSTYIQVYSM